MRYRELKPIVGKESQYDEVAKLIDFELWVTVYAPIMKLLGIRPLARINSLRGLAEALIEGQIRYEGGLFKGKFSAAISKYIKNLGGVFVKGTGWRLAKENIPPVVLAAISESNIKKEAAIKAIKDTLDKMVSEPPPISLDFTNQVSKIMADLDKQAVKTIKPYYAMDYDMTDGTKKALAEDYTNNMLISIKNWQKDAVLRLRDRVEANAVTGYRADNMVDSIQAEYGVSQSKAKFLARQETSLFVSKYREETYKATGINMYRWRANIDNRVRQSHRDLNGLVFSWDSPPVTDAKGNRHNPGEDYGCRCKACPMIPEEAIKTQQRQKDRLEKAGVTI